MFPCLGSAPVIGLESPRKDRSTNVELERYSFGVGDRFAHQARAQLAAFEKAKELGVTVVPVWNKSNREHTFIGSEPTSVKAAANKAIVDAGWTDGWHVDADHIRLETVDRFMSSSDFFTIDVADSIGRRASDAELQAFVQRHPELLGEVAIPGIDAPIAMNATDVLEIAAKYLEATCEAGQIYRHIATAKGEANFIAEVSMDETDLPQTPRDLLVILAALADQKIRLQTIAPKFTGRFNKGVDYVGDLAQFEREFRDDLAVIRYAITRYGLPSNLKLSIHSGSDKFSLYPIVRRCLSETGAGIHIKTAGTTWLEELIGLSEAGGDGLVLAKEIYAQALEHIEELCGPYASVIDIDRTKLPSANDVHGWSGTQLANALRHIPSHPQFNANMRQLLHVAFKLAAKAGARYTQLLEQHADVVSKNVTENLWDRHVKPLFFA